MRERGTLESEERDPRLRHRAGDVGDDLRPHGRRVRVLCPPGPEAIAEGCRNIQPRSLEVRQHEWLQAVLLRSCRERVE